MDPKIGYDLHHNDEISHNYQGMFSTEMYSQQAIKTLREHDKDAPLFMMVSFQAPHNPFVKPPQKYFSHYEYKDLYTLQLFYSISFKEHRTVF